MLPIPPPEYSSRGRFFLQGSLSSFSTNFTTRDDLKTRVLDSRKSPTPLIPLGPALAANSLCQGRKRLMMREPAGKIGNSG